MADDLGPNGGRYNAQRDGLEMRLARIEERLGEVEKWQARSDVEIGSLNRSLNKHLDQTAEDARRSADASHATLDAVNGLKGEIVEIKAQRGMVPIGTLFLIISALGTLVVITGAVIKAASAG